MRVRAGAHRQVVLAREPERLVVERLSRMQPRVVDLEHVDVGEVAVERARVRDRVHPVEGVGEVDEAVLRADRGDRVGEREPARDLLAAGTARSPRPGRRSSPPRRGSRSGRGRAPARPPPAAPPKRLWSVTAIAPSPIASAWSSSSSTGIEQSCDHEVCMCRSHVIHGRPASGSPSRRGRRRRGAGCGRGGRARRRRRRSSGAPPPRAPRRRAARRSSSFSASRATAAAASSGWVSTPGGSAATRAPEASASSRSRWLPSIAGTKIAALAEDRRAGVRVAAEPRVDARDEPAGDVRASGERPRPEQRELPAGQLVEHPDHAPRATGRSSPRHSSTISRRFRPGRKSAVSTPGETTR